ncbi:hypothetical protein A8B73_05380 [Methylosinus sp. 3S-1]|nr:hypothetical protein A8B73_05380 [Methylosinus sp. 3S-1]
MMEPSDDETERYLRASFCDKPFRNLETSPSGFAYVCCSSWLPTPIGDINSGIDDIWFGRRARALRASILDGSFRYCSRVHCSEIANRNLPRRDSERATQIMAEFASASPPTPKNVVLSHDRSCNLSCPSCRSENIVADKIKQAKLDEVTERLLVPMLRRAETVFVTGSGDPFGSAHFRRLLKRLITDEFSNLRVNLGTNGQLFDARAWRDLGLEGRVREVQISIDAARPETYSIVRRGGTFERLLANLEFIEGLRRSGVIESLHFSMVVQRLNFREMPDFVRLGRRFAADSVAFNMIRNWGTFSRAEFEQEFVGAATHPDFEELTRMLSDPILQPPYAQLGNIVDHVRRSRRKLAA